MLYRVLKAFVFHDFYGRPLPKDVGELVDVLHRGELRSLLAEGVIGDALTSAASQVGLPAYDTAAAKAGYAGGQIPRAGVFNSTPRVALLLHTSLNYSGGRIHLYQYAWCLADLGAEVWLATDGLPKWAKDYPPQRRLHVIDYRKTRLPSDLDLIVTDSKNALGKAALLEKRRQPWAPLVGFNFETSNWVKQFCPDYAAALGDQGKGLFKDSDAVISNSAESERWMAKWLGDGGYRGKKHANLPPAVNTFALKASESLAGARPDQYRKYAVWSARGAAYKGGDVAVAAVAECPEQLDLLMFGQPREAPKDSALHKFKAFPCGSDASKFAAMRGASMVLAPSLFEGFGMVPGEALASGTPCLVYDLPVLRQEYGAIPGLHYVKWGDRKAFKAKVAELAKSAERPNPAPVVKKFGMPAMRGRIQGLPYHAIGRRRVSVQLIAYWGFLPEALESVYAHADEIFVAYGRDESAAKIDDGTLERLRAFPDPDKKLVLEERDAWHGKLEMREWCLSRMSGNYHILLDGDEIWDGLGDWLDRRGTAFGCPRWVNLWHGPGHWIHDGGKAVKRWGASLDGRGSVCPHYRCSPLRRSYRFAKHPVMSDASGVSLHPADAAAAKDVPSAAIYHLGHALSKAVMEAKHNYYLSRDGADDGRKRRKRVWHAWSGKTGDVGDGIVRAVDWELPALVKKAFETMKEPRA